MTDQEIQDVRAAWRADENCIPTNEGERLVLVREIGWRWGKPSMFSPMCFRPEVEIEHALPRRLLELGAWVGPVFAAGQLVLYGAVRYIEPREVGKPTPETLLVCPSLISCMARAIVALTNTRSGG